jgi:hypothetical protein
VRRLLSSQPFTYLGRVSYSTYLWHWPIVVLITRGHQPAPVVLFAIVAATATTIAAISFRLLEHPLRVTRVLDRLKVPVIAIGFTTSIVMGALVIPPILNTGGDAVAATGPSTSVYRQLSWRKARHDIPKAPDCVGRPVSECIVVPGPGPKVMLMGDSNALMWLPSFEMIARREGWQLSTALVTTCPWQRGLLFAFLTARVSFCAHHQADWYDRMLPEVAPDIVILIERAYDDPRSSPGVRFPDNRVLQLHDKSFEKRLIVLSLADIDTVHRQGRKVVVIEPIPQSYPFDPIQCLSEGKSPKRCTFTVRRSTTPLERAFRREAGSLTNVWSLDLDRVVCPRWPTCDTVVNNVIVFRDGGHVTKTFALASADAIQQLFTRDRIASGSLRAYVPGG